MIELPIQSSTVIQTQDKTLAQVEVEVIKMRFAECSQNINKTADSLGIGRATLYRKLSQSGLLRSGKKSSPRFGNKTA